MLGEYENVLLVTCTLKRGFYVNLWDYIRQKAPLQSRKSQINVIRVAIEANASYLENASLRERGQMVWLKSQITGREIPALATREFRHVAPEHNSQYH
jgi:hypothetical protein